MYEICLPRLRWMLQHSLHTNTPRLIDAQEGSSDGKRRAAETNHSRIYLISMLSTGRTWSVTVCADVHRVVHSSLNC